MHYEEEFTVKRTGAKRKRRAEERKAVSLSAPRSKTLTLMGTWLTLVEGKHNRYSHDDQATAMDPTANVPYPISVYLGHCDVGYDPGDHLFLLRDPSQMTRFQEDAKAVQPESKRTRTVASVRQRTKILKEQQAPAWTDPNYVATGTTRSGRSTTSRQ
jgi:hypothetical protein